MEMEIVEMETDESSSPEQQQWFYHPEVENTCQEF